MAFSGFGNLIARSALVVHPPVTLINLFVPGKRTNNCNGFDSSNRMSEGYAFHKGLALGSMPTRGSGLVEARRSEGLFTRRLSPAEKRNPNDVESSVHIAYAAPQSEWLDSNRDDSALILR